jgi:hypothetical protein
MGFSKKTAFSVSEGDPFCHECSLWLEAYLELIRESNHCIYIENQFCNCLILWGDLWESKLT